MRGGSLLRVNRDCSAPGGSIIFDKAELAVIEDHAQFPVLGDGGIEMAIQPGSIYDRLFGFEGGDMVQFSAEANGVAVQSVKNIDAAVIGEDFGKSRSRLA